MQKIHPLDFVTSAVLFFLMEMLFYYTDLQHMGIRSWNMPDIRWLIIMI